VRNLFPRVAWRYVLLGEQGTEAGGMVLGVLSQLWARHPAKNHRAIAQLSPIAVRMKYIFARTWLLSRPSAPPPSLPLLVLLLVFHAHFGPPDPPLSPPSPCISSGRLCSWWARTGSIISAKRRARSGASRAVQRGSCSYWCACKYVMGSRAVGLPRDETLPHCMVCSIKFYCF